MTIIESEKLFQETINNLNGNGDGRFSFLTAKRRKSRISSAKKFERELKSEKVIFPTFSMPYQISALLNMGKCLKVQILSKIFFLIGQLNDKSG